MVWFGWVWSGLAKMALARLGVLWNGLVWAELGWAGLRWARLARRLVVRGSGDVTRMFLCIPGSWWESCLSVAWIAPPLNAYQGSPEALDLLALDRSWPTIPAYVSSFVVVLLTICSLRFVSARTMFIPAFVLFGIALHSVYGLGESFLFSANYTWASVIAIGLLVRAVLPRQLGWLALSIALILFIANVLIWKHGIEWLTENNHLLPPAD